MGRQKPFLYVVIRTRQTESGYDVVPASDDQCDRCLVVFGPASKTACTQHIMQLQHGDVRAAG
ncbi:MAG: hypothetical protein KC613_19480 [Myxococcales bacterium]|nr:hypothetical protein [Myxococcales bacterium]MCB9525281.1 hypothetical protein [Myxococcales bacterium]